MRGRPPRPALLSSSNSCARAETTGATRIGAVATVDVGTVEEGVGGGERQGRVGKCGLNFTGRK